jgi:hypothetical protein
MWNECSGVDVKNILDIISDMVGDPVPDIVEDPSPELKSKPKI